MKHLLSSHERDRLKALITETEKQTNTQIVLAVIGRCDTYTELPWKAFALGASLGALVFYLLNILMNYWFTPVVMLLSVATILFSGTMLALAVVLIPRFAKCFLSSNRAEIEVRQYAESLFLSHELFETAGRDGVLLLVSMFERQIVVLPDKGIRQQLSKDVIQKIMTPMAPLLKRKEVGKAMEEGLKQIITVFEKRAHQGVGGKDSSGLSNEIIEEEGA